MKEMGFNVSILMCKSYYSKCPALESTPNDKKLNVCLECQAQGGWIKDLLKRKYSIDVHELSTRDRDESYPLDQTYSDILDLASLETTFTAQRTGSYGLIDHNISEYYVSTRKELQKILPNMVEALKSQEFDIGFCFNGRFSTSNMFFNLCKKEGIPCILHEKGVTANSFKFLIGNTCSLDKDKINKLLKHKERSMRKTINKKKILSHVHELKEKISQGHKQTSHYAFLNESNESSNDTHWLNKMRANHVKIIGYFPSTFDEGYTQSVLPMQQLKLLFDLNRLASMDNDIAIIVRIHPNFWRRMGVHNKDLIVTRMIQKLRNRAVQNFHIVEQNGINSIDLCKYIDAAIVPNSSLALDIRLTTQTVRLNMLVAKTSLYEECGDYIAENLSRDTYRFINEIKSKRMLLDKKKDIYKYEEIAYSLWNTEMNISIKFEGIGSDPNNPFLPDMEKLKKTIDSNNVSSEHDISLINNIIWRALCSKGYISIE
ncbi:hypothetical protein [Synechococcus sp. A15-60]|uniref:hypothetical protein n=1 Tax=Synechococcus sp. A15-60 TaxID=1050655 RepID=UPI00164826E5|nr:hypothetical protein [Synechococcus sp. A15-60]